MRSFVLALYLFAGVATAAQPVVAWRTSTPEELALDAAAFEGFDQGINDRLTDVQSVVVVLQGRIAYQYHRDGNPEVVRDTQSVAKSVLAALVGVAFQHNHIASLDQPVVDLMPQWRALNADPLAHAITLRHLLSMTAGFEVNDAAGTAAPLSPAQAWARPLRAPPGQSFAYDNSVVPLVATVLEKATARPFADYAREHLVHALAMGEPGYQNGLQLRTVDMARLGHLFLQDGAWKGKAVLPPGFVAQSTRPHSGGGPPVHMPYGLGWWLPSASTYFASGYGGQYIWVHPPMGMVIATTSTVSKASHERGQAMRLIRGRLFQAVVKRVASPAR